jgi:hypothetical protein
MLLLAIFSSGALAMGLATVWLLHKRNHRWPIAVLAGLGATLSMPFLLLTVLVLFPPVGILAGGLILLAALGSYDRGHVLAGTALAAVGVLAIACAGLLR